MSVYVCSECRTQFAHHSANCPACRAFNALSLQVEGPPKTASWVANQDAVLLSDIPKQKLPRISTNTREFDRVLGGGIVAGSTVLVGGDPGVGKSTLILQTCMDLSTADATNEDGKKEPITVLYVSAEETAQQIKDRADRLSAESGRIFIQNHNDVYEIEESVSKYNPDVLVIDSIQTMQKRNVEGAAGSVIQVRESAQHLVSLCRSQDVGCFLIAHVTKDGNIAGPKTLEHLVDAVLEFTAEGNAGLRCLRASKNRFGSIDEMGLFQMSGEGLRSVENPTELLFEAHTQGVPGVCIALALAGRRPIAVEVQTLAASVESAKRNVTGMSRDRVQQILAILEKRCDVSFDGRDLYATIAGGIDLRRDPGLDLAVACSFATLYRGRVMPEHTCVFGEIGLAGEIRLVPAMEARIKAAHLMGFETIVGPFFDGIDVDDNSYVAVSSLSEVFEALEWEVRKEKPKRRKLHASG